MALNNKIVHFIGIGGIGMSALARYFLAQKWLVSGSDASPSQLLQKLKNEAVKVKIGHKKGIIAPKTALVIYNQAIPSSNPEIREARRRGIKILSYPQALGELTRKYKTIAVSGAHGKSTTTALLSLILIKAGFDPTVIVGTLLKEFGDRNFRFGKSGWLVIEADEFHASFLNYSPACAIITNIDREHLDYYKNFSNVKKSFLKFIGNIKSGGILVANKDNKNLFNLKFQIQKIAKRKNFRVIWYGGMTCHTICRRIKKIMKVPGTHNLSNALAAFTLAKALGIKEKDILKALSGYRGVWRRMEFKGELSIRNKELRSCKKSIIHNSKFQIPVYDDYAHHPTEIKATLQAFREKYPKSKIICVFQPHQAERLKLLFKDFKTAFSGADYLILLPVYQVAGRDKLHKGYTSADLAKAISIQNSKFIIHNSVMYLPSPNRLLQIIKRILQPIPHTLSPVIVMMGAGDIVNYTELLLKNKSR